jgi:hypothetical protein
VKYIIPLEKYNSEAEARTLLAMYADLAAPWPAPDRGAV